MVHWLRHLLAGKYRHYLYALAAVLILLVSSAGVAYVGEYRAAQPELSWHTFATSTFAVRYPPGYAPDPSYGQDIAPGRHATGVKFVIDPQWTEGTNLAPDSFISVEYLPTLAKCSATPYLYDPQTSAPITDIHDGKIYSFARADGVAAGNVYEEQVFVPAQEPHCLGIRYYLHSTNMSDYYDDSVRPYKREALLSQFDDIRRSLVVR